MDDNLGKTAIRGRCSQSALIQGISGPDGSYDEKLMYSTFSIR